MMDINISDLMEKVNFDYTCKMYFEDKFIKKLTFESKLNEYQKIDTNEYQEVINKFREIFSQEIKEKLKKIVYDIYKELKKFKNSEAPFIAKDYERNFLKIIKSRKETEKYSTEKILLEIPLHPTISLYNLKLRFSNFGVDVENEGIAIIYNYLLEHLNIKIDRKQRYTKLAKLYFGNRFLFIKEQLDNDKEKDSINKLARTILNFNTKN